MAIDHDLPRFENRLEQARCNLFSRVVRWTRGKPSLSTAMIKIQQKIVTIDITVDSDIVEAVDGVRILKKEQGGAPPTGRGLYFIFLFSFC